MVGRWRSRWRGGGICRCGREYVVFMVFIACEMLVIMYMWKMLENVFRCFYVYILQDIKVACSVGEGLLDGIVVSEADAVGGHPDKEVRAALRPQANVLVDLPWQTLPSEAKNNGCNGA